MTDFRSDYPHHRDLDDGRTLVIVPLTFGRARLAFADESGITGEHW
jgi:hypothetical protein